MGFPVFDDIRDQLVSDENPARDDGEMDYERCAALHNAIVKHGWIASGRPLKDLPTTTCWEADEAGWEQNVSRLQPSMVEFLKRAHSTDLPTSEPIYNLSTRNYAFFYYLGGLVGPGSHVYFDFEMFEDHPGQYMTLYTPNDDLGSHARGLIYDQETHECLINLILTDFDPFNCVLPWQRLETTLSVYIDMIESKKAVCLSNDVEKPGDFKLVQVEGEIEKQWRSTVDRPDALLEDPATGAKRDDGIMFGPWIIRPYTQEVLDKCIQTWDDLVATIEQAMPMTEDDKSEPEYGLADEEMLDAAALTDDFARKLLLRARRPRFMFIAPGLRLPSPEEFIKQPFKSLKATQTSRDMQQKMPTLLFRGEDTCPASPYFPHPYSGSKSVPTGLYLEGWADHDLTPFTDAARLLLPFSIGGNNTWAQTSNGVAIEGRHDMLYQIGENPFISKHGVSLLAFLQNFKAHVDAGDWPIDERGVSGTIKKFRDAETEEYCNRYVVPMGPGAYW